MFVSPTRVIYIIFSCLILIYSLKILEQFSTINRELYLHLFLFYNMARLALVLVLAVSSVTYGRNIKPIRRSPGVRIVNGKNTTIEQHPYQISLELFKYHYCGGSLIRPNVVLTAAHCMEDYSAKNYRVRAGSTLTEKGGTVIKVSKVCDHPDYDELDYDVSVLKLAKSFKLSEAVQVIPLQDLDEEVPTGTLGIATGWGALDSDGNEYPKNLQKVELPKVDQKKCRNQYRPTTITDRMTCYGYPEGGKDSCQGDSGGPLVVNGKQVGVVSFGDGCAEPNKPGVYTRLENEEIYNHINDCLKKFE